MSFIKPYIDVDSLIAPPTDLDYSEKNKSMKERESFCLSWCLQG